MIKKCAKYYVENFGMPIIPLCSPSHTGVSEWHKNNCGNPGKVPLIKEWSSKGKTTIEEIESWEEAFVDYNIGVVLGSNSGIIAIDVDGKEGKEILRKISNNDLPDTWQYSTPNNGMRYMYKIPDDLRGKVKFKKYYEARQDMEHVECALLGDGQQTVLPPSIHSNGKKYSWIKNHSPKSIEIAIAPNWMIQLMIKSDSTEYAKTADGDTNFGRLETCKQFKNDFEIQKYSGLDEDRWFRWMSILVNSNKKDLAEMFSELSHKHNERSKNRIEEIANEAKLKKRFVRCVTVGCSREKIQQCFGNVKLKGETIVNSPCHLLIEKNNAKNKVKTVDEIVAALEEMVTKLIDDKNLYLMEENMKMILTLRSKNQYKAQTILDKISKVSGRSNKDVENSIKEFKDKNKNDIKPEIKDREKLRKIGFSFDDDGNFKGLNINIFAKHIAKNFDFVVFNEDRFYEYKEGRWVAKKTLDVSTQLRKFLHGYVDNIWSKKLDEGYIEALKREVPQVDEMDKEKKYINLKNGMINLETFQLEEHKKELYSSMQIPIDYNNAANCPNFKAFLQDVFENDNERIELVQEIMGYCLTAETKAQKAFVFLGEGSNGKSVLCEVMQHLYGRENISSVPMCELKNAFARHDLVGKTVNMSTENECDEKGIDTQDFKSITTGDVIRVEEKYKNGLNYKPICKLVFAVNKMPYSRDRSYGFIRRLVVVPFNKRYKLRLAEKDKMNPRIGKADPNLMDKLLKELDGILNFALDGLKRLRENDYNFTESSKSDDVIEEYKAEINVVLDFVKQNVVEADIASRASRTVIREKFDTWCQRNKHNGSSSMSNKKLWTEFRKALDNENITFEEKKSNGIEYFQGIRLSEVESPRLSSWSGRGRVVEDDSDDFDELE